MGFKTSLAHSYFGKKMELSMGTIDLVFVGVLVRRLAGHSNSLIELVLYFYGCLHCYELNRSDLLDI